MMEEEERDMDIRETTKVERKKRVFVLPIVIRIREGNTVIRLRKGR